MQKPVWTCEVLYSLDVLAFRDRILLALQRETDEWMDGRLGEWEGIHLHQSVSQSTD
jgi:hypothetical protein